MRKKYLRALDHKIGQKVNTHVYEIKNNNLAIIFIFKNNTLR